MRHTEGPWRIGPILNGHTETVYKGQLKIVSIDYADRDPNTTEDEARANLELMAAAPNMLAALKKAYESINKFGSADPNAPDLINKLETTIAKAEGES